MNGELQAGPDLSGTVSRRTVIRTTAWSLPVVAVAAATPLAAASVRGAALTFAVDQLVDVEAPYGTQALTVTNMGTVDFTGQIVFSTPAWSWIAPFTSPAMVQRWDGTKVTWTLPAGFIPAGQSVRINLEWTRPFPRNGETRPLTAAIDPTLGSITPVGSPAVASPYRLLWFGVTPGGAGSLAGTPSLFIANTTEVPLNTTSLLATEAWTFPRAAAQPLVVEGTTYPGQEITVDGQYRAIYNIPTNVPARTGRLLMSYAWLPVQGSEPIAQQQKNLLSVMPATGVTLTALGSPIIYSAYRP
jgi:hypothetical protein